MFSTFCLPYRLTSPPDHRFSFGSSCILKRFASSNFSSASCIVMSRSMVFNYADDEFRTWVRFWLPLFEKGPVLDANVWSRLRMPLPNLSHKLTRRTLDLAEHAYRCSFRTASFTCISASTMDARILKVRLSRMFFERPLNFSV